MNTKAKNNLFAKLAFYQAEIDFDLDINGDGIKAVATGNKDNPYLSEVLVDGFENSGDANNEIALFKSDKGVVTIKTEVTNHFFHFLPTYLQLKVFF